MNYLMDLTAVDYSAFGKAACSGFLRLLRSGGEPLGADSGSGTLAWTAFGPGALRCRIPLLFTDDPQASTALVVPVEEADAEVDSLTSLCGRAPTGWSARSGICSGSAFEDIRT